MDMRPDCSCCNRQKRSRSKNRKANMFCKNFSTSRSGASVRNIRLACSFSLRKPCSDGRRCLHHECLLSAGEHVTGLQRLGVRLEVTEAVLNHISGSCAGIAGVYQRHDWAAEKRAALDAWAAHVLAVAEGQTPTGNVVALGRAG